jgi:hypothetical protein
MFAARRERQKRFCLSIFRCKCKYTQGLRFFFMMLLELKNAKNINEDCLVEWGLRRNVSLFFFSDFSCFYYEALFFSCNNTEIFFEFGSMQKFSEDRSYEWFCVFFCV